jgi:ATP-dependent RNA helicase DeaD
MNARPQAPEPIMTSPEEHTTFNTLGLDQRLLLALDDLGFSAPTPIQAAVIQHLLDGKDVIGQARTGSGKTAAFGLPLLHRLDPAISGVQALVVCPTRELALQVSKALQSFATKLRVKFATVYGGAPYPPQIKALRSGASVVVGTPGRLIDHLERGNLDLSQLRTFVLDEADEMLRMGFIDDVERLFDATPEGRQVALFSATMPEPIRRVAMKLADPVEIQVEDRALSVEHIDQHWIKVPNRHKFDALVRVLQAVGAGTTLVFCRTRASCAETADALAKQGLAVDALHGDLNQPARERVLGRLRARRLSIVIATDVASRGIDVDHITHIVNYDLPPEVESYVHRIGRTSRASRRGTAISFITPQERFRINKIQQATGSFIHPMEVPTDADIVRASRGRLVEELREAMDEAEQASQAIDELMKHHEWTERQLAEAALTLLARREGVLLGELPEEGAPEWARSHPKRQGDFERTNEVELFIPIGKKQGLTPAEVVGALTNSAGLDGREIGRISITIQKSFVGLPEATMRELLSRRDSLVLRGREVRISAARVRRAPEGREGGREEGRHYQPRKYLKHHNHSGGPMMRRPHRGKKR